MYITVSPFIDLQDEEHGYNKGDVFPRPEAIYLPTQERYDQIVEAGFIVEQVEETPKTKSKAKATDESEE
jgi:hypothetical protein|uniref:Uncharacterized protein n=1 Tax=Siphoviridae sp. ct8eQ1 TaxID=2826171 RepID=A0A8S5MZX3_9CAUD|nr:MAG TPA: hypothetical protein [Siphoviridae sp. ct8eQ1]DAM69522.1 MAG TPA: hypothetical protein [Caudoviricetes sp.]